MHLSIYLSIYLCICVSIYLSIYLSICCISVFFSQYDWRAAAGITGCRTRQFLDRVLAFIWCVYLCVHAWVSMCPQESMRDAANCKNRQKLHGRLEYEMLDSGWQTGQTSSLSYSLSHTHSHTHTHTHTHTDGSAVNMRNGIWRQT